MSDYIRIHPATYAKKRTIASADVQYLDYFENTERHPIDKQGQGREKNDFSKHYVSKKEY